MLPFSIIVVMDKNRGIGSKGQLPWHLPADLKHFKEITSTTQSKTKKNAVIMGRKTWDSLPSKFKPLPERINLVLSRDPDLYLPQGVFKVNDLYKALQLLEEKRNGEEIESAFVIGGEQIFKLALMHPACEKIYATHIASSFPCDVFFPAFSETFQKIQMEDPQKENNIEFYFTQYTRKK